MATKARQQYFADEISLQKQRREFSLEDNIKQKIDSVEAWAQVNTIETVKVNGTALTPDANKAVNVEVPDVIDNLYSTSTDDALSAKQWKVLYDYLQNIASRWRFLSNWNCATGLPVTNPTTSPYTYMAWDYYSISNVATWWGTNYRPDGSSYTIWQASTTTETEEVNVSDFYLYDGTNWLLLVNTARQIAVDSSLSTISTNPVENRVVTNAINAKVWVSTDYWNDLLDWAKIWLGTETDYSSMISRDSNTIYIQYVTSSPTPPSPWRQPWANTIAYYPLTSATTTTDMWGNNNLDLTNNWGVTFWVNAWVDCASINSSQRNALSNQDNIWKTLVGSQSFTYCLWIYVNSFLSDESGIISINNNSYNEDRALGIMTDHTIRWYISDGNVRFVYTPVISTWQWYLLTLTQDGDNNLMSIYLNWSLSQSISCNGTGGSSEDILWIWAKYPSNSSIHWYVSNVIIEDKARTATEISDYYDQTKWDYWIS